jgi:hypothetical protein
MRRRATISALLLVGVGVVLGMTVFRADIAQATGLAQSVTVNNTTTNPVPVDVTNTSLAVREQNLDGSGNVKVHEQGTANVNVTNSSLTVAPPAPITGGGLDLSIGCPAAFGLGASVVASALTFHLGAGVANVELRTGTSSIAYWAVGPAFGGPADVNLALDRPISFDTIECTGSGTLAGGTVGNSP